MLEAELLVLRRAVRSASQRPAAVEGASDVAFAGGGDEAAAARPGDDGRGALYPDVEAGI